MSGKSTYIGAIGKKEARKFLFSFFKEKSIVGLAGPDIEEYISWCKDNGIENIEIWENDAMTMFNQLAKLPKNSKVIYNFGDIYNASTKKDTVYDFDYTCTVPTVRNHIKKFKDERFVMTFCARKIGQQITIEEFFYGRREKITNQVENINPVKHWAIKTYYGNYIVVPYFDTIPMLSIAKIS
jgi:hypothetical protein